MGAQAEAEPDFDALFAASAERVLLFLRLQMGPALCARLEPVDALQDVYLKASALRERFTEGGERAFASWLCRIAGNHLGDLLRHHGAARRQPARAPASISAVIDGLRADATGPATAVARGEQRARLGEAIAGLEEHEREVVLMRFFQQHTLDEIAHRTSRSPSSVRRLLGRATARLGALMGEDAEEGAGG